MVTEVMPTFYAFILKQDWQMSFYAIVDGTFCLGKYSFPLKEEKFPTGEGNFIIRAKMFFAEEKNFSIKEETEIAGAGKFPVFMGIIPTKMGDFPFFMGKTPALAVNLSSFIAMFAIKLRSFVIIKETCPV